MTSEAAPSFCIGFLGADWWGSDARALSAELRGQGHMLIDRHYEDYFPTKWRSVVMRGIRRLLRNWMAAEYNRAVEELLQVEAMDFLLVFKGMLLSPKTLQKFRVAGIPCYCVYPDVSFQDHGANIWDCLPLYDCVFTTKSFHLEDSELRRRVKRLEFVPHGFDPEVHRPIPLTTTLQAYYSSDLSFVGVWTPKKEQILSALVDAMPDVKLKIWGPFWERANLSVRKCWQGRAAYGDELAAICTNARINLGLLSEAGGGTVKGDQTTARTWQIPACGGFMLHEDTEELRAAFSGGEHIAVFRSTSELANAVRQYLGDDALRDRIRVAGYQHCLSSGYSYRPAADRILTYHRSAMGQA
jgi:spore maturation protein CgeB